MIKYLFIFFVLNSGSVFAFPGQGAWENVVKDYAPEIRGIMLGDDYKLKERQEEYIQFLKEVETTTNLEDAKRLFNKFIEELKEGDNRFFEELNQVDKKMSELREREAKLISEAERTGIKIEQLENKEKIYINGLLGALIAATVSVLGMFIRILNFPLERKKLMLEIEAKKIELNHNKSMQPIAEASVD